MMGRYTLVLVAWVTCYTVSAVDAGELLRWKLKEGQGVSVEVLQITETTTKVNDKTITMEIEMTMAMDWTVDSVAADGTAKMTQVFTRLAIKARMPGRDEIAFDSASREEPAKDAAAIAAGVKPLVGAKFSLSMTELGVIEDVQVPEETLQTLAKAASGQLKDLFSEESIAKTLKQSLLTLPADEVNPDATWSQTTEATTPLGKMAQHAAHVYAGVDDETGLQKILVTTTLKPVRHTAVHNGADAAADSNPQARGPTPDKTPASRRKSRLKQHSSSGVRWFDNKAGRLSRSETQQQLVTESRYRETKILVTTDTTVKMTMHDK